ncbi:PTS 2-O-a-mannosyl-D-glycerate transporter subunit IIABC [Gemmiger formicilis]|uniref:PTS 2-O-a-mannosyl-D-glycerate transporter subunit IIABC n=1 Tax=Gemmiger formicilis TaxID=745368 RepID=UPI0019574628|nr:PTS 2-O-a-mannosyl-D-glycerate transporter subunit IIABC [Gemmiger formicilis]MBM6715348.1 PTS 2-O-a-mannosyl-D-glycerate transporter subunit IIABC [Gemmiger formicilis]
MDLKQITNEHLIVLDCELEHKLDVIRLLVDRLYEEGKISDKEQFWKDVMAREALSETGISDGVAIPHGKSDAVKEASFAFARLKKPAQDWESMEEDNQVTLVFLLAIPTAEAGSTHLDVLAALMTRTQDEEFLNMLRSAKTPAEIYNNLNMQKEPSKPDDNKVYTHTIVAVTACPAGIAHTYMAADALEKAGEEMGVKVYVEKQGANGVEGRQTPEHLRDADAAIFAVDVAVKESERFAHLPTYKTRVAAPIKDAQGVIRAALELAKTSAKGEYKGETAPAAGGKGSFLSDVKSAVLTGISYIIPIIVAGGMINAFAVLIAQGFGLQDFAATEGTWMYYFKQMGSGMLGTIMIPVLAAYMAYSLGDKTALAPGFAAGIAANLIGGGFLCGMLGGLVAGYSVRGLRKVIPAKGTLAGFVSFWVYPVLSTIMVGIAIFLVLGKPVAAINTALINMLGSMSGSNGALLGAILGIMVSFDLGGPVNKAAYTFCVGAMAEGILMPYAAFASVKMVSGFAVTAATKLFGGLFTKEEKEAGNSTWLLVLAGITEGAIPFMMADPLRVIPSLCIGSAVTGAIIGSCGIGLDVPGAGIFSMFLLKDGLGILPNALIWFFAAVAGAAVSTLLLVILRKAKLAKAHH